MKGKLEFFTSEGLKGSTVYKPGLFPRMDDTYS